MIARVPDVVIGEPVIEKPVGTVCVTEVTVPLPAQDPLVVWKHPAVSAIPFAKDDVPRPVEMILPPVIVSPEEELSPAAEIPPAKVEVAVEDELMAPPNCKSPATESLFANVEEALAIMFWARRVDEACKGEPDTKSPLENVEEAEATSPPEGSM